jgi:hypothetical protein
VRSSLIRVRPTRNGRTTQTIFLRPRNRRTGHAAARTVRFRQTFASDQLALADFVPILALQYKRRGL